MIEVINNHTKIVRKIPIGAEVIPEIGVHFRVWAPHYQQVDVVFESDNVNTTGNDATTFALASENNGYFSGLVRSAKTGSLYRYRLDGSETVFPDPASRFQPHGPSGPSEVIDPSLFLWTDGNWQGVSIDGQVIYEMHIGTFTPEGNFKSASHQLSYLADIGITVIELMPVADFPGKFGWGYDGVDLFSPSRLYGRPDDFRHFVNEAHAMGIGVIIDVVYNHLGPVGNYLKIFSKSYFTERYRNDWGEAINFDGEDSGPVREFFLANAGYWIQEFHIDGLRIDATQQIFDKSNENILAAITRKVRENAGKRKALLIAENEPQQVQLVRPLIEGGYGMDGLWNDDFHHSAMVALTGHKEAYYSDYCGNPQEFISSIKWGYLYQGQFYKWQKARRGTPCLGIKPSQFIIYIQNHDQIANSGYGLRAHYLTSPGLFRALTALLLLAPATPMIFQGQEFAASSPFYYFSDVSTEISDSIHQSRLSFLKQFRNLALPEMQNRIVRPDDPQTFERSKLDLQERNINIKALAMHCDLLKLRREDAVFHLQRTRGVDGAVISSHAFILRFFGDNWDDRLIIINLGIDLHLDPAPEPLLAPPPGKYWQILWSSENPVYGGSGTPSLETEDNWRIPGQSAVILTPSVS